MSSSETNPVTITIVASISSKSNNNDEHKKNDFSTENHHVKMEKIDFMDQFNHPRSRVQAILKSCTDAHTNHDFFKDDTTANNTKFKYIHVNLELPSYIRFDQLYDFYKKSTCDCEPILQKNDLKIENDSIVNDEQEHEYLTQLYKEIHNPQMTTFLCNSWKAWVNLGKNRDPDCFHPDFHISVIHSNDNMKQVKEQYLNETIPPLIPQNFPLRQRPSNLKNKQIFTQRPSNNVMGQMGYYCTDRYTPIVSPLRRELCVDAEIVLRACFELLTQYQYTDSKKAKANLDEDTKTNKTTCSGGISRNYIEKTIYQKKGCVYALTTHPGHHAGYTSFGGYCYLNNAALAAQCLLHPCSINMKNNITLETANKSRTVAILDVDYHCGNGTADIFYHRDDVMVVSIHCDPDIEYPFHSGHKDQIDPPTTLHIPLAPGTSWEKCSATKSPISVSCESHDDSSAGPQRNCYGTDRIKPLSYKDALYLALDSIVQVMMKTSLSALVVSLGLDTHHLDPVAVPGAGFTLVDDDYRKMGNMIGNWSRQNSVPVIFIQEGGYIIDKVGDIVLNVLNGFILDE